MNMKVCKSCNNEMKEGHMIGCKNCGAEFCSECADKTMRICPHCYSDMEYIG